VQHTRSKARTDATLECNKKDIANPLEKDLFEYIPYKQAMYSKT